MFKYNKESNKEYIDRDELEKTYRYQEKIFNAKLAEQQAKINELIDYLSSGLGENSDRLKTNERTQNLEKHLYTTNLETNLQNSVDVLKQEIENQKIAFNEEIDNLNDIQVKSYNKYYRFLENNENKISNLQETINKELFEIKQNYLMKNIDLSIDEKLEEEKKLCNKRKLFSPICEYYDGCDKYLRKVIKGSIDMTNSKNFLKKEDFITYIYNVNNSNCNNDLNDYINPEISNNIIINNNINKKNYNNNLINSDKKIDKIIDNKNENEQIEIDINMKSGGCDYMNIPGEQFMDYYYCQIPENNLISKFTLLNNIYFENYLKFQENKKRQNNKNNDNQNNKEEKILQIREGDWLCSFCYNLNFSFRVFCNRCKAPKM